MHSLRFRFTAFLVLVALVPITVLYFYNVHSNDEIKEEHANDLLDMAFLINGEINSFLETRVNALEVTAGSLEGRFSGSRPSPVSESVDILERLSEVVDGFGLLLQLDSRGRLLAAAATTNQGERINVSTLYKKDWSTENWFTESLSAANNTSHNNSAPHIFKPFTIELVPGVSGNSEVVLPVTVPVRNSSNEGLGSIVAFIRMQAFERILKRGADALAKIDTQQHYLHLIDADGFVYTEVSQQNNTHDVNDGIDYTHGAMIANIKNILAAEDVETGREISQWFVFESTKDEAGQLVVYDKRPSAEDIYGLGWITVINLPTSEAFAFIEHAARDYLLATLATIAAVLGFGFWAGTYLTKPIISIIEAMSRLRKGSSMEKVDGMDRRDEIGKLANTFISFQYFINDRDRLLHQQAKQLKELKHAHSETETMMESSTEPMIVVNIQGIIDRVNPVAEKVFGYDHGELVGEAVSKLVPASFKQHDKQMQQYMKKPDYRSMSDSPNLVGVKKDGSEVALDISLSPLESVDGMKVLVIIRDLTRERHYQQELRKLATVVEKTNNLVVVTDNERHIEWVNDAFLNVTGYSRAEIMGKKPGAVLQGKETDPETVAMIDRAIHSGKAVQAEILNYTKDGRPIWLSVDIHPVYAGERIEHYIGIETDITERRLMEDQLRNSKNQLEDQVAERTRNLSEALEKADAAAKTKSAFLATMSHEIRTPINGIVGMVELLRRSPMQLKQHEMLDVVKDSSLSLQRIIDDILDYSKIEAGKLSLEKEPMSLQEQVMSACEALGPIASSRNINLIVHFDDKLPEKILADSVRLRQILYNLIGNALKFSEPSGVVHINIVARDISDKFAVIEIIVMDAGIGMSMHTIDHLFTAFSQADDSTTRRYGGTGLGLSICQRLVDMMGGKIDVESTPGEGSIFKVVLEFPVVSAASEQVPDLTGLRVLGVNIPEAQQYDFHNILRSYISEAGTTVDCLYGKDEAFVQAVHDSAQAGNPYDVVLICQQDSTNYHYATYEALHAMPEAERPGLVMLVPKNDLNIYEDVAEVYSNPLNVNKLLLCLAVSAGKMVSDKCCRVELQEDELPCGSATITSGKVGNEMIKNSGHRILLAEDNAVNREVITMQLEALGFTAVIAHDGREALELWKQHPFDLVLTDCNMPEMDGFELAESIRKAEAGTDKHVPVIAVTANAMSEELDKCLLSGMDDCITKPVELDVLDRKINQWLPVQAPQLNDGAPYQSTASISEATNVPVDLEVLAQFTGGDAEQCKQLLRKFKDSSTPIISELITASEEARFDDISAQAHKLKSSAKTVGAACLAELCIQMEQAGKDRVAVDLGSVTSKLTAEFDRVKDYIDQLA